MQIGLIGLGRMEGNMAVRLLRAGHTVVAHDRSPAAVEAVVRNGARSRRDNSFAERLLAPLRNACGGHAVRR